MKVFNWLHQKLHPMVNYSPISEEKDESVRQSVAERDTQALLLHDVLLNGILTIGTLGLRLDEEFIVEPSEKPGEEEKEVVVVKGGDQVVGDAMMVVASKETTEEKKKKVTMVVKEDEMELVDGGGGKDGLVMDHGEDLFKIQEKPLLMEYDGRNGRERTTLADLFAADVFVESEARKDGGGGGGGGQEVKVVCCMEMEKEKEKKREKAASGSASGRKLYRLMRRMMRKKIHPEQINGRCNTDEPLMTYMCQPIW